MKTPLIAAALTAAALVAPAPAQAVVAVDCSTGPVVLSGTDASYELTGACSSVRIEGSGLVVQVPSATELKIEASSSKVLVDGALGSASLRGAGLVLQGSTARRVKLVGSSGDVVFKKLRVLRIKGAGNHATVKKGRTKVSVTGAGNVVKVNRRG